MPNKPRITEQYRATQSAGGLYFRADRGLIEVTGADRATWLNNLVTNVIKTLQPGEGNYAFAVNIQGRVAFDMNMLVLDDRLWLDIDMRWLAAAMKHLNKYIIAEKVELTDISSQWQRAAILGSAAPKLLERFGVGNLATMARLQHVTANFSNSGGSAASSVRVVRHDFAGLVTAELYFSTTNAANISSTLRNAAAETGIVEIDRETVEILRIEAGIPNSVDDIDAEVVPPETLQVENGISYHKGCYLGQEVIERMRSHGVLARRLVGVRIEGQTMPPRQAVVEVDAKPVGRITSSCWSESLQGALALGYVKTAAAKPETPVTIASDAAQFAGRVITLPAKR